MTTPFWFRPVTKPTADSNTDVVIVGGGFVGLSVAYWLTELKPELNVTVLDRGLCGLGASGRNAGFLTKGSAYFYKGLVETWGKEVSLSVYNFAKDSLTLIYEHFLKKNLGIDFEISSSLTLLKNQSQYSEWKTKEDISEAFEFNFHGENKLPANLKGKFIGGLENGPEYKVHPLRLLQLIKEELVSRKVQIIESNAAFNITAEGIETELNTIKARQVILAINGYFPEFNPVFKGAISSRRAQMLAIELEGDINCPHLYYDPLEKVYWRKIHSNIMVIGGKRLLDETGEIGNFEKNSVIIQSGLEQYLSEELDLKYRVIGRWSGTMGFTEHELPFSGRVGAPIETYMIGGFSGHGMGLGFNSALDLAKVIVSNEKETFYNKIKKAEFRL